MLETPAMISLAFAAKRGPDPGSSVFYVFYVLDSWAPFLFTREGWLESGGRA